MMEAAPVCAAKHAIASTAPQSQGFLWWQAGVLVALVALAYHNVYRVPFLFDDYDSFVNSQAIRSFGSIFDADAKSGVVGRPLAALTFAFNWWWGKESVTSYHVVNNLIHALSAVAWYGVMVVTLQQPVWSDTVRRRSSWLSFFIVGVWCVHPIHTESVTYISQRTESLMGLFYGLALWLAASSWRSERRRQREILAWMCMLAGSMVKEVIVTLPIVVFLWDRVFAGVDDREQFARRRVFYVALAFVSCLIAWNHTRVEYQNVGTEHGVGAWPYFLHSCWSLCLYAKLSLVPYPLVFDYGLRVVGNLAERWPYLVVLVGAAGLITYGLWRRAPWAFAGAFFFGILVPVSSVVPILGQPTAEHRVYVSSLAVIAGVVLALHHWINFRWLLALVSIWAATFLGMTVARNFTYQSGFAIMEDTYRKQPNNERAMNNYVAQMFPMPDRWEEGIRILDRALRIRPDFIDAYTNRGTIYSFMEGREAEALRDLEKAIELDPLTAGRWLNYGNLLRKLPGRADDAVAAYNKALGIDPELMMAIEGRATILTADHRRRSEAIDANREFLRQAPQSARARLNLGSVLVRESEDREEAVKLFREALELEPENGEAHYALATALQETEGGRKEAILLYITCLRLKPDYGDAHLNLGRLLAEREETLGDAVVHFERAVELNPDSVDARYNCALAHSLQPDGRERALEHLRVVLQKSPQDGEAVELLRKLENK